MIGGEGGAFQAPQQRVGGGNTDSNEGREDGATLVALGSGSILFKGFYLWEPRPKVQQSLCTPPTRRGRDRACPDRWADHHQAQKAREQKEELK